MKTASRFQWLAATAAVLFGLIVLVTVVVSLRSLPAAVVLAVVVVAASLVARWLTKKVKAGTVLELDLEGGVVEAHGTDLVSRAATSGSVLVRDIVDALDRAAEDDRITAFVARVGNGKISLGHAQEIRDAVGRFRKAGKRALAYAETFGEAGQATVNYYLATAFSEIYLMPLGEVSVTGLLARGPFIRGLLDKLGVVVDMHHREEYKSFLYLLTEKEYNEYHRESTTALVGDQFDQIIAGIAESRELTEQKVRELVDTAPHLGDRLVEDGLVDQRGYRDDVFRAAGGNARLFASKYLKKAGRPHRKGDVVAFIQGVGGIARGSSRFDPLGGGPSFGSDDVAGAFRKAVDDDKVKAIVFRVDSPGGSAIASEVVRHEVVRATKAGKPVVVSMGNVAASGGYWVSASASHIVAQPGTVTGSIGVVSGKLATREAWAKAGITFDQVGFGDMAGFTSPLEPFTEAERRKLDQQLDTIYGEFLTLVSTGRGLSRDRVAEIAKGRVWTGAQAKEIGLVDSLGGLDVAIEEAKKAAQIVGPCKIRPFPKKKTLPLPESRENSDPSIDGLAAIIASLKSVGRDALVSPQVRMRGF